MNENSSVVDELRSAADKIAQAAVAKDYARRPDLLSKYGERGRVMYLQDTRFHISYLTDAIAFGRTSIFKHYLDWLGEVLSTRGVPPEDLVESLRCLREVMAETLSPSSLPTILQIFDAAASSLSAITPPAGEVEPALVEGLGKRYLECLLRNDRNSALELVENAVKLGTSIKDIWLRVFQDSQYEVGRLWQANKISIAQEHYCTAATQMIMSRLYSHIFAGTRRGRTMVTACAPGEVHELGMRMVADLFEIEGWDTYHLGANMPTDALVKYIAERRPDLVGLSATMTFHLASVAAMISALRGNSQTEGISIIVGGHAFNREPGLWRDIGADGHATDVENALLAAERIAAGTQA